MELLKPNIVCPLNFSKEEYIAMEDCKQVIDNLRTLAESKNIVAYYSTEDECVEIDLDTLNEVAKWLEDIAIINQASIKS